MFLEDCPLCRVIRDQRCENFGKFCASAQLEGSKTIVLLRHDSNPSSEEVDEVFTFLGNIDGLVTDASAPGHWAVSKKVNNWVTEGKSVGHEQAK